MQRSSGLALLQAASRHRLFECCEAMGNQPEAILHLASSLRALWYSRCTIRYTDVPKVT